MCVCILALVIRHTVRVFFYASLYCHVWPVWLYHLFSHYIINGTIFGKKVLNIKFVLVFTTTFA